MPNKMILQFAKYAIATITNGAIWAIGYNAVEIAVNKLKEKLK